MLILACVQTNVFSGTQAISDMITCFISIALYGTGFCKQLLDYDSEVLY